MMAARSPGMAPLAEDLVTLDDLALLSLVTSLPQGSPRGAAARELLVIRHEGLVRSCVRPYLRSPVPAQDLMQVGYVGLLKAIGHFDPAAGASLATYARPCISGELKRYFRDARWPLRVGRPVQELVLQIREADGPLTQLLGRTPDDGDLARHLGVSADEVRQARQAQLAFSPSSLDAPLTGPAEASTLGDFLGAEDPRLDHMIAMHAIAAHWGELPQREQQILIMEFQGNLTQAQIGQLLRISQMHVSRLRSHALDHLRARLLGAEPGPVPRRARRAAITAGKERRTAAQPVCG